MLLFLATYFDYSFAGLYRGLVLGQDDNNSTKPLPNATINILGTDKGTLANRDGYFELQLEKSQKIIVSYIGYRKDTLEITDFDKIHEIVLIPELKSQEILIEELKPTNIIESSQIAKTEIITQQGLLKAACCNLSESFQTNPSVDVTYTDAISGVKQIQLLGLAQTYTQILTEKVPNLQGMASNFGLSFVPGPWMNSISISKGSSSVSTGYESITGQINVDYKTPEDVDKLYLNLYANDAARFELNSISKYNPSDHLSTAYFLHSNFNQNPIDMNADGFVDLPLTKQLNLLSKISYNGHNYENKTSLQALYHNQQSGQMNFISHKDKEKYWGASADITRVNFYTKNGFVFDGNKFQSIGTIVGATHHKQNSYFGTKLFNTEQNSMYLNLLWQSSFDSNNHNNHSHNAETEPETIHNYITGISLSYNNYIQKLDDQDFSQNETVPGIFFEYTYTGIHRLTLMPGIRTDYHSKYGWLLTPRFHLKYELSDFTEIRASIGKGYHNPLPLVENQNILISNRQIVFLEDLKIEEALNFGINTTSDFALWGMIGTINTEYYYTTFQNQAIIDMENNINEVRIYNLKGKSFSHNFQVDANIELFNDFNVMFAYRYNDVRTTIDGKLLDKPLIGKSKFFANVAYSISGWAFDFTMEFNGSGRLPETTNYPTEFQLSKNYPSYYLFHSQITKSLENFEIYLGGENLTNFKQPNPIIAYNEPFGKYFDSSMIWGPVYGRKIYLGIRYKYN